MGLSRLSFRLFVATSVLRVAGSAVAQIAWRDLDAAVQLLALDPQSEAHGTELTPSISTGSLSALGPDWTVALPEIPVHAIFLADADGSHPVDITQAQVTTWLDVANSIWAAARIRTAPGLGRSGRPGDQEALDHRARGAEPNREQRLDDDAVDGQLPGQVVREHPAAVARRDRR